MDLTTSVSLQITKKSCHLIAKKDIKVLGGEEGGGQIIDSLVLFMALYPLQSACINQLQKWNPCSLMLAGTKL